MAIEKIHRDYLLQQYLRLTRAKILQRRSFDATSTFLNSRLRHEQHKSSNR